MKKLTTILCALFVLLSVNAAPNVVRKTPVKKAHAPLERVEIAHAKREHSLSWIQTSQPAKIKQGEYTVVATEISESTWDAEDNPTSVPGEVNNVQINLYSEEYTFVVTLYVTPGEVNIDLGKTYTEADMQGDGYSYIQNVYDEFEEIVGLSYLKTIDDEGLVHIKSTITTGSGNIFHVTYDEEPFALTGDTVVVDFETPCYIPVYYDRESSGLSAVQFEAYDGVNYVCLTLLTAEDGQDVGEYTTDDIYYGEINGVMFREGTVVVTKVDKHYDIQATLVGDDGVVYEVSMFFDIPQALSQETITSDQMVVDASYANYYGEVWADVVTDTYTLSLTFYATSGGDNLAGEYTMGKDMYGSITFYDDDYNYNVVDFYSGTVAVEHDNGYYHITGTVLAINNVEYTLDLTYSLPEASRQEEITLNGEINIMDGFWQVLAFSEDGTAAVSLAAVANQVPGTYTVNDLFGEYTFVYKYINETELYYDMIGGELVVAYDEESATATISGNLVGYCSTTDEAVDFLLNITATLLTEDFNEYDSDSDYEYNFLEYTVDDSYLFDYGCLLVTASQDLNFVGLEIYVPQDATGLVPGTYTVNDSQEPFTVISGDCEGSSVYYSFAGLMTEDGYVQELWLIVGGTVTVDADGVITVDAVNSLGRSVKAVLDGSAAVENVTAESTTDSTAAIKRIENGQFIIEHNGVKYNASGMRIF